jgi:hypothetical protein
MNEILKEEVKGDIAYQQCSAFHPKGGKCVNMLPLDRFGRFAGKCGKCGQDQTKSVWWLAKSQRDFQTEKARLRKQLADSGKITLQEFDYVAKKFL